VLDTLIEAWRRESRAMRDHRRELPWPAESSVQLALHLVDPATTPSAAMAREELLERVKRTVQELGDCDHEILWMRHYDQLSFKEAAAVLGISENAATVRYARALKRLRDRWLQTASESNA
jgi:RNA polymerase sigma-70 factor (ECF subfamily)